MAEVAVTFVSSHSRRGGAESYLATLVAGLGGPWVEQVVCLEEGPLVDDLRAGGVPTEVVPTAAGAGAIASSAIRLRRLLRRARPAVVHANGIKAALVSVLATAGTRLPVVWVKHDFSWDGRLARLVASRCCEVVGVSEAVTATFPPRLRARVHVVHNGLAPLSVDREAARRLVLGLLDDPAASSVVSLVGRIDPNKGHREVLAAASRVLERAPGVRFTFVGAEHEPHLQYAAELRRDVAERGLGERVLFLGFREDARELIAGSDVVVIPSVVDDRGLGREGFPLVGLEALALGTPVVGYDDGGLPELTGECGTLVPPGDRGRLAEGIIRLVEDRELRDHLARCGRRRVTERFSFERMVEAMKERYRAAANGGAA